MRDIKFVNHSCFSFDFDGQGCLVDPWFYGSVFNNSWKLVSEGGEVPNNIKYIFISHEHPDHLHWPTLKKLSSPEVTVILCQRKNTNVEENLKRLGYKVLSIPNEKKHNLGGLNIEFIRRGHDHTIIFEHDEFVMVNQNDCQLGELLANKIKQKYPKIDIWWMQFSLAGYYGNLDQEDLLLAANKKHKDMFSSYKKILDPKISIPFASFVNFCREENHKLNNYRVKLEDILLENSNTQILYKGDEVLNKNFESRNKLNIDKWERDFDRPIDLETPIASRNDLELAYIEFCNKYQPQGQLQFDLYGDIGCVLNLTEKTIKFESPTTPIAKVCLFDLCELFKNPWGADTMNITSCFHVYMKEVWKALLVNIDSLYTR